MSKKSILVAAVAGFFLLVIGVYFSVLNLKTPPFFTPVEPRLSPPPSAISDWKTYKNPSFGYSLFYPPEFKPREQGRVSDRVLDVVSLVGTFEGKYVPLLQVKVSSLSYEEELTKRGLEKPSGFASEGKTKERILVSGLEGVKVIEKNEEEETMVTVLLKGETRTFILVGAPEIVSGKDYTETVNQMISNFVLN
jgi:hypothetical protein